VQVAILSDAYNIGFERHSGQLSLGVSGAQIKSYTMEWTGEIAVSNAAFGQLCTLVRTLIVYGVIVAIRLAYKYIFSFEVNRDTLIVVNIDGWN